MKHKAKLIQNLIEHSKNLGQCTKNNKKQEQQTIFNIQTNQTIQRYNKNSPTLFSQSAMFQAYVQIGDGRSDHIIIYQNSDIYKQAQAFCKKHSLQDYIIDLLAQSLHEQLQKERRIFKYRQTKTKFQNMQGADKILSQKTKYRLKKQSRQLWKQAEQTFNNQPKINQLSSKIVQKMGGKNKIIEEISKKFKQKAKNHVISKIQYENNQIKDCSFQPSINPISQKVDQTLNCNRSDKNSLNRFEYLYQNHRQIQNRKQIKRRNSLNQILFRPSINKVSKCIIEKKKSLGEIVLNRPTNQLTKVKDLYKQNDQYKQKQHRQLKQRNSVDFSAGKLCYHLYQQAKKRQDKIQKETQRIYGNQNNWKIIENSNNLISNLRQNKIRQMFHKFCKQPHKELHFRDIQMNKLCEMEKIFIPLFKQMEQIDLCLNQEQFVQAGMRLLKYVSPCQRAILVKKNSNSRANKENDPNFAQISYKRKQSIKQQKSIEKSIYIRGLIFKSQIKNQIEKSKQQKVRKQLKDCTFKPKIHSLPQNIAY